MFFMTSWNRYVPDLFLMLLLPLSGCIEQYYPDKDELKTGTMVVEAHLTSKPGEQSIQLSRSSTIQFPEYDPITGCYVKVEREDGDSREFEETDAGEYTCMLDEYFLGQGKEFHLIVITSEGSRYESEYEKLHPPAAIESVYWKREDHNTSDPEFTLEGVQFYLDFEINKEYGQYLRWELDETYEIHNPEYESYVVDKDRRIKELPDSSLLRRCWISMEIPWIYLMDLESVEGEKYRRMPLNYVSSETRRLNIRYSLLVRQLSLSKTSFSYWNELELNLQSMGELFDKQPMLTQGNICNVNNGEEVVLGYFSISGVSEKRIFLDSIPGMKLQEDPEYCFPAELPARFYYIVMHYPPTQPPIYLSMAYNGKDEVFGVVEKQCIDCREYKGSSHIKPAFW